MFLSGWYLHKTCSPGYFPTDAIVDDSEMAKMTLVCAFPTSSKSYVFE